MSDFDIEIAARTLYGEFRGEPLEAQRAGAQCLQNRLRLGRWGNTLAQVCLYHAQFSCWLQSDPNWHVITSDIENDKTFHQILGIVVTSQSEPDFTNGATHYYALSMKTPPYWAAKATSCGQFGNSKFYKGI